MIRKLTALLLMMMALCLSSALAAEIYQVGDAMEDFTVTTYDGKTITLSEVLGEKDAVLINIWATWCPPCKAEFPYMEQAYQEYRDRLEIVALSCEAADTDEVLADFAAELGLTFPIGRDTAGLAQAFNATSIPTSVIVDRFGRVCYIQAGAMTGKEAFTRLFDAFVGEGYTRSVLLSTLPGERPAVAASTAEELSAALSAPGGEVTFANDPYAYAWPMIAAEKDGRSVVASTNGGQASSQAAVNATVNARAGDVIAVTFKTSTYPVADLLRMYLNGAEVKAFGGEEGWQTYAIPVVEDGEQTLALVYEKLSNAQAGEDAVWIDSVALLSGEEAAAALAANPAYPVAESTGLTAATPGAREIVFDDPTGVLRASFGDVRYYIVPGGTAEFTAHLAADVDPEAAYAYSNFDGAITPLAEAMGAEGYAITSGMDSLETTGYEFTGLFLYASATGSPVDAVVFFADEANVDSLVSKYFPTGSWAYAAAPADSSLSVRGPAMQATYRVTVLDQSGAPVPGAMVQICDEEMCQVLVTAADGAAQVELEPKAYEVHLLKLPEGYSGDTTTVTPVGAQGCELVVSVVKE